MVEAVLTGRVTRRGDTVNVQLDLVNTADGTQLWGERYRTTGADLNALQDQAPARSQSGSASS
jgi:TolB-like protein